MECGCLKFVPLVLLIHANLIGLRKCLRPLLTINLHKLSDIDSLNPDCPLGGKELRGHQFNVKSTENVPVELQAIDLIPSPPTFDHALIEKTALQVVSTIP